MFLGNVAYKRDNIFVAEYAWRKIGKLFYNEAIEKTRLFMYGFRQGLCIAKPNQAPDLPYVEGEISVPVGAHQYKVEKLFVGYVTTAENKEGETIYSITFECVPLIASQLPAGIWLDVENP